MYMQPNGAIVGSSSADMKGYPEINSRATRFSTELESQEKIVRDLFFRFNEIGDGRMSWTDPMALDAPYSVHATFNLAPIADLTTQGAFQIPVGLAPGRIAVLGTFKPFENRQFSYVCNSHIDEESYTLELPESIDITQIPKDIDFNNGEISFSAKYDRTGGAIKVTRRLVIQYPSRVCQPEVHHRWKEIVELIRSDYKALVFYKPSKP